MNVPKIHRLSLWASPYSQPATMMHRWLFVPHAHPVSIQVRGPSPWFSSSKSWLPIQLEFQKSQTFHFLKRNSISNMHLYLQFKKNTFSLKQKKFVPQNPEDLLS